MTGMRQLKIMTYNIQHGVKGLGEIAKVIYYSGAAIIGMNEVDCGAPRSLYIDQVSWLARKLNMYYAFAPAKDYTYGNALLTQFPIIESENRQFSNFFSNEGKGLEKRSYLFALLKTPSREMGVVVTHLGLDKKEREYHIKEILAFVDGKEERLIVLMGDFNALPHASELILLEKQFSKGKGSVYTYPVPEAKVQIDYIFVNRKKFLFTCQTINAKASDHFPLVCRLSMFS